MGDYNPNAPIILGQEWPGIREVDLKPSTATNAAEYGHTFEAATAYALSDGRFYVKDVETDSAGDVFIFSIYPRDRENESGPVRKLLIPAETVYLSGGPVIASAATALAAISYPTLSGYISMSGSQTAQWAAVGFNTAPYTILQGKRILDVSVRYGLIRTWPDAPAGPLLYLANSPYVPVGVGTGVIYEGGENIPIDGAGFPVGAVSFGEISTMWNNLPLAPELLPWTFEDIQRFDAGAASRLYFIVGTGQNLSAPAAGGSVFFWYAGLEITYCEEIRAVYGATMRGTVASPLQFGANPTRLRAATTRALNPIIQAGSYTAVVSAADRGGIEDPGAGPPILNALRELYAISSHEGVRVDLTRTVDEQFERVAVNVLPQLSVHVTGSGAPLTEVHSYGRLRPAPVYGTITATQEIYDNVAGAAYPYPQFRYYARRWGNTTQPLVFAGLSTLATSTHSLTVDAFDALPEIVDGWKEITDRFSVVPTMGALSPDPQFQWSASAETAGNRWEILAVAAPAQSGIPGDLLTQAPSAQRLGTATYQPPVGSTVELSLASWYASGAAAIDPDVDAFLIFSQDPPTVTGLAVSTLSQSVSGIAMSACDQADCCAVVTVPYNRITWNLAEATVSGSAFGFYELQRYDPVDAEFKTIMSASSWGVSGFSDYEARIGQPSVYRVRVANLYQFYGAWSDAATGTAVAPVVGCADPVGTLLFTSNSDQTGASNLGYVAQFEGAVAEAFAFPEADQQRLRRRFNRDYPTAFIPTERQGESFTRLLLTEAVMGPLPNLANTYPLRNLAVADLPYVCVRDELGNRWFAALNVPSTTRHMRLSNLTPVRIDETSADPYPVDPS